MQLLGYWRSSAAFRVRIGLNLKGLEHTHRSISLPAGEQRSPGYLEVNPQGLVPTLTLGDGRQITQSLAILEWLDEVYPQPALLPADPFDRAQVRAMAQAISADIHPLHNLRVLNYLRTEFALDEAGVSAWIGTWINSGFEALEELVDRFGGTFCFGDAPSLADACLYPQLYSARRFACDMAAFPHLTQLGARLDAHPLFAEARPERQADAPPVANPPPVLGGSRGT